MNTPTPAPAPVPDVSILIVAYNSQAIIADCLASIAAGCAQHSYDVLLIDNGDGLTEALVAAQFPAVRIIASRGNVGFAAGNNILAEAAGGKFLLLLNPDVVVKPGAIDALLHATTTHPSASAWGGVTLDRHDRPDVGNSVHIPSLREMASRTLGRSIAARRGDVGITQDAEVAALSGSFAMIRRTAWDDVGGLDDRYFLYCEEVDLFYRLGRKGHTFWRIGDAFGFHDVGHGEALSGARMLYRAAGNMQFARLHWSPIGQFMAFALLWLGAWQRFVIGRITGRWLKHFKIVGESHRDIALRPHYWRYGYDPQRGLLAKMKQKIAAATARNAI